MGGRGDAQLVAPEEGQVAVGVVFADDRTGGLDRRGGRRDVRVKVFEAEDLGVGARRTGDAVDGKAGDAVQAGPGKRCPDWCCPGTRWPG